MIESNTPTLNLLNVRRRNYFVNDLLFLVSYSQLKLLVGSLLNITNIRKSPATWWNYINISYVCGLQGIHLVSLLFFITQEEEIKTSKNIISKKLFAEHWISQINKKRTPFIDVSILLRALQKTVPNEHANATRSVTKIFMWTTLWRFAFCHIQHVKYLATASAGSDFYDKMISSTHYTDFFFYSIWL